VDSDVVYEHMKTTYLPELTGGTSKAGTYIMVVGRGDEGRQRGDAVRRNRPGWTPSAIENWPGPAGDVASSWKTSEE